MFGSVSGYSYTPNFVAFSALNSARNTPPAGFDTPSASESALPVQSAAPVGEIISNDDKFSIESLLNQHGSDPVAMATRMRIQYPGQAPTQSLPCAEAPELKLEDAKSAQEIFEEGECQTCENRKYQDGSDDPGVSFKTATHLSPEQAATAVRGHEMEHVVREQAKASREDREIVSQSVTISTAICPECGTVYASGGTTRTVTRGAADDTIQQAQPQTPAAA